MSIFRRNKSPRLHFILTLTHGLSFRGKLLLAMMLVVLAVTSATLYLAENNLRANQQKNLDTQFQNQLRSFLAVQDMQAGAITERCRALSHSVRLRAALEERDVDDLYRNALAELQGIFDPNAPTNGYDPHSVRASFFRFFDAGGAILPPSEHPAGLIGQPSLHETLAPMGRGLSDAEEQSVGFIALARGSRPSALREVVLTKIRDWNGRVLGTLVLGFPITPIDNQQSEAGVSAIQSGIWLN